MINNNQEEFDLFQQKRLSNKNPISEFIRIYTEKIENKVFFIEERKDVKTWTISKDIKWVKHVEKY